MNPSEWKYGKLLGWLETAGNGVTAPGAVVLCDLSQGSNVKYVTWFHNRQTGGNSWGNYFSDKGMATEDFILRCQKWAR